MRDKVAKTLVKLQVAKDVRTAKFDNSKRHSSNVQVAESAGRNE